jgi:hypothetical protein
MKPPNESKTTKLDKKKDKSLKKKDKGKKTQR